MARRRGGPPQGHDPAERAGGALDIRLLDRAGHNVWLEFVRDPLPELCEVATAGAPSICAGFMSSHRRLRRAAFVLIGIWACVAPSGVATTHQVVAAPQRHTVATSGFPGPAQTAGASLSTVDLLVFAPHPDDEVIGVGGVRVPLSPSVAALKLKALAAYSSQWELDQAFLGSFVKSEEVFWTSP